MIEAARRYGVVLMEAMIATLNPNFRIVREQLPRLGTIRRYFASYCQYSSRYDKFREGVVLNAFDPSLSNGAMMDIGVYTVYRWSRFSGGRRPSMRRVSCSLRGRTVREPSTSVTRG